jgi:hypothetical protein
LGFYFPVFSLSKFSCLEMYMKKKKQFVFGETFTKDFAYFGFLVFNLLLLKLFYFQLLVSV